MYIGKLRPTSVAVALAPHFALFSAWSVVVVFVHMLGHYPERIGMEPGILMVWTKRMVWTNAGIPFNAIAALGGALAIFLGFRNNSAYDRWWEARKIWGGLVNDSRSWARQVVAWSEPPEGGGEEDAHALRVDLIHRHLAFVHGLAHHLRGEREALLETVARFTPEAEAARYGEVPNVPTALLIEQGRRVAAARAAGQIEHFRHLAMDQLMTRLSDIQGKCERIKNTPLPQQYDALPRWFVYFYGAMLPFGLAPAVGWGTIPISASITVIFLSLERSGRLVENPFDSTFMDTPMTALATTIERDLRAALGEPLPDAAQPNEYDVLM